MMDLKKFRKDYHWEQALEYGDEPETAPLTDHEMDRTGFGLKDVAEVLHADEGEKGGEAWVCVLCLNDGRYAYLEAGCDYTGWGCQAGGSASVARTYADIMQYGVPTHAKRRFGLAVKTKED